MDGKVQQSWDEFLNPDILRPRLMNASIYIAGFEGLKRTIIHRARDFFSTGFSVSGDTIDPKYESDVLALSKSPLYASLGWLKKMNAIEDADIAAFERAKSCRNRLAHNLFMMLASEGLPTDFENCFRDMVDLLRKIEVWWIVNVEIPTNPDFDEQEIDEDDIVPGPVLGMQLLCDIALGDDKRSRVYYEKFREHFDKTNRASDSPTEVDH